MRKSLLLLLAVGMSVFAYAQTRTITGKVTADDGTSLPGVNVIVKGTTNGTVTDADGKYSLLSPAEGGTLVFSFIGFQTTELLIGASSELDVKMAADVQQLSEVVVTGVGVATDKRKVAISVASVMANELPQAPSASVDQALIGKIAGAQITSRSGTPGADVNILLRGINTVNRTTTPMILIDGVQAGATSLQTIDLNSIERVEVIQGAAAATIYGAQGANGVIQLFTKKGKAGKFTVDIASSISNNTYLNTGDVRKADKHAFVTNTNNEVIGASGNPITFDRNTGVYSENVQYNSVDPTAINNKPYDKNFQYVDHFKFFFRPANSINNSIAISGGSEKIDFSLSASNSHQESNLIDNGYWDRSNFTSNLGFNLAKGLTFRSISNLAFTKSTLKTSDRTIMFSLLNAYAFADFEGATLPDGTPPAFLNQTAGINHQNPIFRQYYTDNNDKKVDLIQSFNLNYKFPKFVEVDMKYGLNYQMQDRELEYKNQSTNPNIVYWVTQGSQRFISNYNTVNTGDITNYNNSKIFQNFLAKATISLDLAEDFGLSVPIKSTTQVLYDYRKNVLRENTIASMGLPSAYEPYNAANTSSWRVYRDYTEPFITFGYLVFQKFDFGEVAGVSAGFRSDYSSAFGQGSKPFTFPRGDGYFRLSGLDFWKNGSMNDFFPELKLRVAYGKAGIQPNPFDRYVTVTPTTFGSSTAFYYAYKQSNPGLSVEVSSELEVGFDAVFSFLKNTQWLNDIGVAATYWQRETANSIYDVDVAPSLGLGTVRDNAFTLGSNGIQVSLNSAVYSGANLKWNTTINYGKQTSEIKSIRGDQPIVVTSNAGSTNYVLAAGQKVGQLYGYRMVHAVDEQDENGQYYIPQNQQQNYVVASNGYVVDRASKQPYMSANKYSFGDPNPKFLMSFIQDVTFKNFLMISAQLDWVYKNHLYNQTKEWMYRDGIHMDYTMPLSIDGGEPSAWTAFYRGVYAQRAANGTKDYFYEDATFARLRNVSVGLDFARLTKIPGFRKLQLVLSGRNIWTATKYSGFDPEISSGDSNSAWDRGTDHSTMPNFKSYQVAVNIGF
ncbi:MAG TPA: SusC/RagA family TonB-linked outer membrane protein [Cyclobacteriaceae bacterium]|nr:SusC/RagA family TonB-linked outer membrane protein [Cyclobacteriaceae bacterium]